MKILFVTVLDITGPLHTGGMVVARRNYDALCALYGNDQIDLCVPAKHNERKANVYYMISGTNSVKRRILHPAQVLQTYVNSSCRSIFKLVQERKYDLLWLEGSILGGIGMKSAALHKNMRVVVFMHNIETNLMWRTWKKSHFWNTGLYFAVRSAEQKAVRCANRIITLNQRDSQDLEQQYYRKSDLCFPVTIRDEFEEKETLADEKWFSEKYILFVGSYFAPNIDAVFWIAQHLSEKICCKVYIVGKGMEKLRDQLECGNLKIVGTVDSIAPYYRNACGVIAPVFSGGGMKVKTAEALMYGKALIAADEALEGYDYDERHQISRCNTAKEFIYHIDRIVKMNNKFYVNNRNLFLEKYCIDHYMPALKRICEDE